MRVDIGKEELKANFRLMRIIYLRKLITKMQCADMGVVNEETYNTAIAMLQDLIEEDNNYYSMEEIEKC